MSETRTENTQGRGERLALIALALILIGIPIVILGYQFFLRPALADVRTIDIVAAAPEAGGFQPDPGRLHSTDVDFFHRASQWSFRIHSIDIPRQEPQAVPEPFRWPKAGRGPPAL